MINPKQLVHQTCVVQIYVKHSTKGLKTLAINIGASQIKKIIIKIAKI